MRKEIDTGIVDRDAKPIAAVIDSAAVTRVNGKKWVNLAEHQATTKVRGGLAFREAPTVVRHCGASASAHQKREFIMF